jgi:hypothetical protein
VAEIVFGIDIEGARDLAPISEAYRPFLTSDEPDLLITVSSQVMPPVFPLESQRVFDAWDKWSLYRIDDQFLLVQRHTVSSAIPDRVLIIDSKFTQGELFLRSSGSVFPPNPLEYPLGQVLMVWLLGQDRGLMIHACGVNDGGRGYLFVGNSGDGKSTLAKIWEKEADVLNDDRIVVRKRNGQFWMHATPWSGSYKSVSPQSVPLERVFFLKQGTGNRIEHVAGARAATMLLTRCFPPVWDAQGIAFTLDFLSDLTSQVPCSELTFIADDKVRDFIRCGA